MLRRVIDLFSDLCTQAFQRSKNLLWPFHFGIWARLALLFLVTGSFSAFNFRAPASNFGAGRTAASKSNIQTTNVSASTPTSTNANPREAIRVRVNQSLAWVRTLWNENRRLILTLAALVLSIILLLSAMFLWLTCRLQFVLLRSLEENRVSIRSRWNTDRESGESLFWLHLGLAAVSLLAFASTVFLAVSRFHEFAALIKLHPIATVLSGIVGFLFLIAMSTVLFLLLRFVPVVMFLRSQSAPAALGSVMNWAFGHIGRAILFTGFYAFAAVVLETGMALLMLALILPFVLVGGLMAVLVAALASHKALVIGLMLVLGLIVFLPFLFFARVPIDTFFTYLRMELVRRQMLDARPE